MDLRQKHVTKKEKQTTMDPANALAQKKGAPFKCVRISNTVCTVALVLLVVSTLHAEPSGRPDNLTLKDFQFAPHNRWAFSHLREVLPTVNIPRDPKRMLRLRRSENAVGDFSIQFDGKEQKIDDVADRMYLDGILVLKHGAIVFERYYGHLTEDRPHLMNSISKSIVSLVAGRLANDGVIDLDKPVSYYVPELEDSGWGADSLQTVLDMRDGSDYSEVYYDFSSTFRLQDCAIGWTDAEYCPKEGPKGLKSFLKSISRNETAVGKFNYRSGSTNVLAWVLEETTGKPLAELISEYVWKPMGAEFDANITVDTSGMVLADHGMSATLRDLGRVGLLVQNSGMAFGEQVLPPEFLEDLQKQEGDDDWPYESEPDLQPYYRSFWWGVGNSEKDIAGSGIHGQNLRVAPKAGIVVVIYSTWPTADGDKDMDYWDLDASLADALVEKFR